MDLHGTSVEDLAASGHGELDTFQEVSIETQKLIAAQKEAVVFIEEKKTHTNDMVAISKLNDIKEQMMREDITPSVAKAQASKLSMI